MSSSRSIVAVVQAAPVAFDTSGTLAKVDAKTSEAVAQGAQLVLFPEAFVGGYPRGMDFGASVGNRSPEGRDQYRAYWEEAIELPSPEASRLGEIAARHGVQLYLAPTADGRDTWLATARHIALEGRCFVLSSNQFCRRSDYPSDYPSDLGDQADKVVSRGGSCIISPLGEVLTGPDFDGECVLVAQLDLGDIARGKFDFDVVGHYARPDVFKLIVNEAPACPVVFNRD